MSACLTKLNTLRTASILNVKDENLTTKTFTLNDDLCAKANPGQFLMLWIPGIDEIPISILNGLDGQVQFTVKAVGDATRNLHKMNPGDVLGIRGPFGNHFTENKGRVLLVGGGTGTAPLLFLSKRLAVKADKLSFIIGAKTKNELLFLNELDSICTEESLISTTDDGSYGLKCLATDPLEKLLQTEKIDMIYSCGPERMVKKIFTLARKYKLAMEASLERLMRCGIGLCGSCMIGKYRVCRDGPVFNYSKLNEIKDELGISRLGFDGNRIDI